MCTAAWDHVQASGSFLADFHEFNVSSRTWTDLSSMVKGEVPPGRRSHGIAVVDGNIYLFGGQTGYAGERCFSELHVCIIIRHLRHRHPKWSYRCVPSHRLSLFDRRPCRCPSSSSLRACSESPFPSHFDLDGGCLPVQVSPTSIFCTCSMSG